MHYRHQVRSVIRLTLVRLLQLLGKVPVRLLNHKLKDPNCMPSNCCSALERLCGTVWNSMALHVIRLGHVVELIQLAEVQFMICLKDEHISTICRPMDVSKP